MKEIKGQFGQTFVMGKRIADLNEQMEYLRYKLTGPTGGGHNHLGVQQSRNHTASEDLLIKILSIEEELAKAKNTLLQLESQIRQKGLNLPPLQRSIITLRYICRKMWQDIACDIEMSEMQILRLHNTALKSIAGANNVRPCT